MSNVEGDNKKAKKYKGKLRYSASDKARAVSLKENARDEAPQTTKERKVAEAMENKRKDRNFTKAIVKKSLFPQPIRAVDKKPEKYKKTKDDVCYQIEDNLRQIKNLKELKWTVEEDAPETKKIFEDKYKRIKANIEKLTKEYSSLKKSLDLLSEGEPMKKSKEELVKEFTKKVSDGEMSLEDVEKSLSAGYDTATPEHAGDGVEEIEASKQSTGESKVPQDEGSEAKTQKSEKADFADGLFKPIVLGSTLQQSPSGNVLSNVRKPNMDYGKVYEDSIRQTTVKREIKE